MFLSLRSKPLDSLDFSRDCLALETYPLGAQAGPAGFALHGTSISA
jgi:hypothetical protein